MNSNAETLEADIEALPQYREILLAVDSSDHANRGIEDGIALAQLSGARITAAHVYAAQMHDMRFRQMEGGLPEQFREEQELERQRDVHDDLITRGLSIIADCYMDPVERACCSAQISFARRALEGKNYRQLTAEANSGDYDLLVMGALGLGAVAGSSIGTVCERVARRAGIDTLVIKSPQRSLSEGPVVAAIDGSERAYGGLLTALSLAREWQVPLHVVSAFDPYYHYVAFNRIAGVLSEEAGKIFRFQEQEKLHEEIIDSGLARIYAGHLQIAKDIAADYGLPIQTELLDGKPQDAILRYLQDLQPSLLVLGKLGIHADADLDIGGNAESLLRKAPCAVLLGQREFRPQIERIAEVTVSWTHEAEARLQRAPDFVQGMARMAILRYAQERGHTVITEGIVEQATATLMPARAELVMGEIVAAHDQQEQGRAQATGALAWSHAAVTRLDEIEDPWLRDNTRLRAEKKARAEQAVEVSQAHVISFSDKVERVGETVSGSEPVANENLLYWDTDALARIARVPEGFMRDACRQRIESQARLQNLDRVTLDIVETGIEIARAAMTEEIEPGNEPEQSGNQSRSKCPFAQKAVNAPATPLESDAPPWTGDASARLLEVPAGYCRSLTLRAVETLALQNDLSQIDLDFVEDVLNVFKDGSNTVETVLPWSAGARARIERAPESVRGMLIGEIETWAQRQGRDQVDESALRAIKREWQSRGIFHLEPGDPRGNV